MDINIICAKQNREEHYDMFLHYLNQLSEGHHVSVYVSSSGDSLEYKDNHFKNFENIHVYHNLIELETFNKSILLNDAISRMRCHYDIMCVMDIDMIYGKNFFTYIESMFNDACDYVVSYGRKLTEAVTNGMYEHVPEYEQMERLEGVNFAGCSQIVMNEHTIELLLEIFGFVYDDRYEGWGGEDSDLSYKSKILADNRLIDKRISGHVWYHLYHKSREPENVEQTENYARYMNNRKLIENDIKTYLRNK